MNDCRAVREAIAAAVWGSDPCSEAAIREHTDRCDNCRRELDEAVAVLSGARAVREEIDAALTEIDWNALSERIADAAFAPKPAVRREPRRTSRIAALFQPRWRPVFAGLLAGIGLGAGVTYMLVRPSAGPTPAAPIYAASGEFIDRVELAMARRDTIDYLEKSEYIILDLVQSSAERAASGAPGASADRARDLLSKKRYFNPGLNDVRMAKARELCNQIEILFFELSQLSETLSDRETAEFRKFAEDKQLLLKIRLLKKELRESEI